MKPLLTRSNSSPHSSTTSYFKKAYRPSSISPCHSTHYHSGRYENENGHTSGVGSIGSVGGWLNRRGSVCDQRQGGHSGSGGGSGGGGQSRLTASSSRNGSLVQQGNGGGKQLRAGNGGFENKVLKSLHATQKPAARELVEARKYRFAMEELSHSIQQITTSTGQQITKLSDTYETITQKLEELQALITRFAETQKLSDEVVHAFAEGQEKFGLEFGKQIEGLGELQVEVDSIRVLQRRLDLQRGAAELYKARLEAVEERISKQKELEMDWRQRDSRRLRIILGVLSILAILWILATPIQDHYLEIDEKPPPPPSPPFSDDVLGVKPEYGGLPKEVVSLEADRLLRARHP